MIDFGTSSCTYILDFIDLKQLMACIRSISQMLTLSYWHQEKIAYSQKRTFRAG